MTRRRTRYDGSGNPSHDTRHGVGGDRNGAAGGIPTRTVASRDGVKLRIPPSQQVSSPHALTREQYLRWVESGEEP